MCKKEHKFAIIRVLLVFIFSSIPSGVMPVQAESLPITSASIKAGNTTQISGVTANDFTNPMKHRVAAEDFTKKDYTVMVVEQDGPSLVWNTFLGGSASNMGGLAGVDGLTVDGSGNVYVVGTSDSTWGNPVRAFTPGWDGSSQTVDAYVAKLDESGNMIWHTFLGGNGDESGRSIAVDGSGNIYVTGRSFATWENPLQPFSLGNSNTYIAKLNSSGVLIWNTFLNGNGNSIGTDTSGNVYLAGNSVATWGNPINAYTAGSDVYIAKLDSSGTMVWNTFLGGLGRDYEAKITIGDGYIYTVGRSDSSWGNPKRYYYGGTDTFVAKLSSSSGALSWNTFLGGDGDDYVGGVAVDGLGNVYTSGSSNDTWGNPIRSYTGSIDVYTAKLDSSGNLLWNTFLGSNRLDIGGEITVDRSGGVYVVGDSETTWGTPLLPFVGPHEPFIANLNSSGMLIQHIFLGEGRNNSYGIAIDGKGNGYIAGLSEDTWGVPVRAFEGNMDGFVAKAYLGVPFVTSIVRASPNPTVALSVGFTVTFSEDVTGVDVNDFSLTTTGITGASITGVTPVSASIYNVTVNTGLGVDTIRLDLIDNDSIIDGSGNRLGGSGTNNGNFISGETYLVRISNMFFLPLLLR